MLPALQFVPIEDSWGTECYVMWIEDCYFPIMYLVLGDNFSDAYDWFLCHPRVERDLRMSQEDMAREFETEADLDNAFDEGWVSYNDNGTLLWGTDAINATEIRYGQ